MQPYELHTVDIVGSKRLKRDEAKYTSISQELSTKSRRSILSLEYTKKPG